MAKTKGELRIMSQNQNNRGKRRRTLADILDRVFLTLKQIRVLDGKKAAILHDATAQTVKTRYEQKDRLQSVDKEFLIGNMTHEENLAWRRKNRCHETPVKPEGSKEDIRRLIQEGQLSESTNGVYVSEPFWQVPYRAAIQRGFSRCLSVGTMRAQQLMAWIMKEMGVQDPLEDREALARDIACFLTKERAIVFSNTPCVFNPFEFDKQYSNHSELVAHTVRTTKNQVVYVWHAPGVIAQVRRHLSERRETVEELKQRYFTHFSKYIKNPYLEIYAGENTHFQNEKRSVAYISETTLVAGYRPDGDFVAGNVVHRQRIVELFAKIPMAGSFFDVLPGAAGTTSFSELRRKLVHDRGFVNQLPLGERKPQDIRKFIDRWFELAGS